MISATVADWSARLLRASIENELVLPTDNEPRLRIPAAAIRAVVTCKEFEQSHRGLSIVEADVIGPLDLGWVNVKRPVRIMHSLFGSTLDLAQSQFSDLSLRDSSFRGIDLSGSKIDGTLDLAATTSTGRMIMNGAVVTGSLGLTRAKIYCACDAHALSLDSAHIAGEFQGDDLHVSGTFTGKSLQVGGQCWLSRAYFSNAIGDAVVLDNAELHGVWADNMTVAGEFRAVSADVQGTLLMHDSTFFSPHSDALSLDFLRVSLDADLRGIRVNGLTRLPGAAVDSDLHLANADLSARGDVALMLDRIDVKGDIAAAGLHARGSVRGTAMTVGGSFILHHARIDALHAGRRGDYGALVLDGAVITRGLRGPGLDVRGILRLSDARVSSRVSLDAAYFYNPFGYAIEASRTEVHGEFVLPDAYVDGGLVSDELRIHGRLGLRNTRVRAYARDAAVIKRAHISGGVVLTSATLHGRLTMVDCRIGNDVDMQATFVTTRTTAEYQSTPTRQPSPAVTLDRTKLQGNLVTSPQRRGGGNRRATQIIGGLRGIEFEATQVRTNGTFETNGQPTALNLRLSHIGTLVLRGKVQGVNLSNAAVKNLDVSAEARALESLGPLDAAGWQIQDLHGEPRQNAHAARRWLETDSQFSAQPWWALASIYERNGQSAQARRTRYWAARKTAWRTPRRVRPFAMSYGALAGWGFYPLATIVWLMMAVVVTTTLSATHRDSFVPTQPDKAFLASPAPSVRSSIGRQPLGVDDGVVTGATPCGQLAATYPCFSPALYAITTVTPTNAVSTAAWTPSSRSATWLQWLLTALKISGWLLTVMFLAGITGLLRRA